ncbi:hypothetical protein Pla22_52620 [Rubripirellula amarantea]|uniref:PEP-CTERM protein-sorting domain-containing protein n=1 Tax=Rubripirellula amarantea TaxID=2527999 RepID=A0A5C5W886_9BACT|nr:PEP-CTERM sorting domain-containing protein [Rubripirellula amarantea]TWT47108.1 hypothetical protein Pla22_52620 [Rubripirellula amarantea]
MIKECFLFVTLVALAFVSEIRADIITNGSFEEPSITANTSTILTPAFWTTEGTSPALHNGFPTNGFPGAQQGDQYLGMGVAGGGIPNGISQIISIPTAGTYQFTWFDTTLVGFGTSSPYDIRILDLSDNLIASDSFEAYTGTTVWNPRSFEVNLLSDDFTLEVIPTGPSGRVATFFDNISVTAVPEPDSLIFLATGCLACFLRRNRRAERVTMR